MSYQSEQIIRVGIADDHAMFRRGIVSILNESARFKIVAEGSNGAELIEVISHLKEPPDVCLLDINMPELNGYETIIALKKKYPNMKFLVLTMLEHEFVVIKMLRLGANGYLLKEDDPKDLKSAIEIVFEKDFYHTDLVSGHLISIVKNDLEYKDFAFTDKELKFLEYTCSEMTYKEIAEAMKLSPRTVEGYRDNMFQRLKVKSRTGLAIYAMKMGLVTLE